VKESQLKGLGLSAGAILVTGHTGFKGTWLTLLLEELGAQVIGFSLEPLEESLFTALGRKGKIIEEFGDIRDYEKIEHFIFKTKPSYIIHMAAQPLVLKSYDDPLYTFEVNVMGTANILNIAFAEKSVRSVVVTTTDKVYKNTGNDLLFSEHDPLEGKDPYSASKVGAESVITAWQHLGNFNDSPRVVAVRSGNVIGGGDYSPNRLFPDLVRAYFSEKELIIRNPYSTRPWQHVLDPLYGYLMVLGQSKDKKISKSFNFGPSEKSLSVEHVIKIAEQVCKDKIKLVLDDENILIKERPLKEAKNLDLNSSRARNEIGWTPFWKQEDAVRDTIRWWQNVLEFGMSPNQACQLDLQAFLARKK
jgi:CDP-glucose 4,6-dehydratase